MAVTGGVLESQLRDLRFPLWQSVFAALIVLLIVLRPGAALTGAQPGLAPVDDWATRAAAATAIAQDSDSAASFAVLDAGGSVVASYRPEQLVPAASTLKVLILAAYLRDPDIATRELTAAEQQRLTDMITWSSNDDASALLAAVGWPAVDAAAAAAGMGDGYDPDRDSWGLTQVTAESLALLFDRLPAMLPAAHREFAAALFQRIVPIQQWGLPAATPQDWGWAVKGGWIDTTVNQVGTFVRGGEQFTVAVTIYGGPGTGGAVATEGAADVPAVRTIKAIGQALFGDGDIPGESSTPQDCSQDSAQRASWAWTLSCGFSDAATI